MAVSTVKQTITTCDFCGSGGCFRKCLGCQKDVCYTCMDTKGTDYKHAVYFSGSGDGFYCHDCDGKKPTPLLLAYREIRDLTRERQIFDADFSKRMKEAEALVESLRKQP